ncbi:unnamed protein product [Arctogadus glacialis]
MEGIALYHVYPDEPKPSDRLPKIPPPVTEWGSRAEIGCSVLLQVALDRLLCAPAGDSRSVALCSLQVALDRLLCAPAGGSRSVALCSCRWL